MKPWTIERVAVGYSLHCRFGQYSVYYRAKGWVPEVNDWLIGFAWCSREMHEDRPEMCRRAAVRALEWALVDEQRPSRRVRKAWRNLKQAVAIEVRKDWYRLRGLAKKAAK